MANTQTADGREMKRARFKIRRKSQTGAEASGHGSLMGIPGVNVKSLKVPLQ